MQRLLQFGDKRSLGERKHRRLRYGRKLHSVLCQEGVADDLGLLLEPVEIEGPTGHQVIGIAAEGVAHHRQIEAAARLGLLTWVSSWISSP